jgi:hypothetical protein
MKLTRGTLLLALAAALSACGDPSGSNLPWPGAGVYQLRTLGDHPVPAPLLDDRGRVTASVSSSSIELAEDGTYHWTVDGPGELVDFDSTGTYTVVSDSVVRLSSGRVLAGPGGVVRSNACIRGLACVFVREGADPGPALSYRLFRLETIDGVPLAQRCCDVLGGAVWLRGDGRYLREVTTQLPGHVDEDGTFQVAGTSITLTQSNPSQWTNQAAQRPLTGTQVGTRLTLGSYGHGERVLR